LRRREARRCLKVKVRRIASFRERNFSNTKPSRFVTLWEVAIVAVALSLNGLMKAHGAEFPNSLAGMKVYSAPAEAGNDLIGHRFQKWDVGDWINSKPLTLDSLRGKVVLIRWWTAPGCPFCEASIPALNEFARRYRDRGLVVLGFYHHKSPAPLTPAYVKEQIRKLKLEFPVAIDRDWSTLRSWWLDRHDRGWTSVSILLDRHGVVRHVHPGGAFFKGEIGYETLEEQIEASLAEPKA
jgi:thiol-disulfide isomerase/thioredoxin